MKLEVIYQGAPVGELTAGDDGLPVFTYAPDFIRDGLELSPLHLPLAKTPYAIRHPALRNLPGLVFDSLPDAYGLMALRERLRRLALPEADRGVLALLALVGEDGIGALEYRPLVEDAHTERLLSLKQTIQESQQLLSGVDPSQLGRAFLQSAGNAGGQHPKAMGYWNPQEETLHLGNRSEFSMWQAVIVKLDLGNHVPVNIVERIYLRMAEASGIETAKSWLVRNEQGAHLVSQRFDRDASGGKQHQHSFAGMAHLDFNQRGHRYEQLMTTIMRVCSDRRDLLEAYRRAVFNVMAHNQDDHAKNFSFTMAKDGVFRLSPAYDLVFTEPEDGAGHWMTINAQSERIRRTDLIQLGVKFNFKTREIETILGEVAEGVATFERFAQEEKLGSGWKVKIKQNLEVIRKRFEV
jgi:serine/threonine-protein kinase HipA